jgi:uncharacterized membrane protein YdjX (TVP38/TMEM64 family)
MQKSKRYLIQLFAVILFAYLIWQYGPEFYRVYSNRNLLNSYLQQAGVWAPAVFVLLTAAQVIAAPIPAMALGVAGGFIFGLLPGFLLSLLGLFIGSMLAFGLAKWFGQPLVRRLIGDETYAKFEPLMRGKGLLAFIVLFLLPFMPDDALCFLAALTPMRARVFALLVLFCRTPGILVSSLTGSGVIALPWYGWALVGAASLVLLYFSWRHRKTLEKWLSHLV